MRWKLVFAAALTLALVALYAWSGAALVRIVTAAASAAQRGQDVIGWESAALVGGLAWTASALATAVGLTMTWKGLR